MLNNSEDRVYFWFAPFSRTFATPNKVSSSPYCAINCNPIGNPSIEDIPKGILMAGIPDFVSKILVIGYFLIKGDILSLPAKLAGTTKTSFT